MTTCTEVRGELAGWLMGELTEETRASVEAHLISCAQCVNELISFKRVLELGEGGPRPSSDAKARLRAAAMEVALPSWRWWERPLVFSAAAASVLWAISLVAR